MIDIQKYTGSIRIGSTVHPALLFVPEVGGHVEVLPAHAHELLDFLQALDFLVVALFVAALHYLGVLAYHDDVMPQL